MKGKITYIFYLIGIVLLAFIGIEASLSYFVNHPEKCPETRFWVFKTYYEHYNRSILQYEKGMVQYDSELFYTLKPGDFTFENIEFKTQYHINSIGCRDDEESINYPKIVVLGDSYAMGWGVQQNETYASIVESTLNINVLNAGTTSYGTPREMKMLEKINTDSMKYLILQYCPNDYGENIQYALNQNQLIISSEAKYDSIAEIARQKTSYYLFKHTLILLPALLKGESVVLPDTTNYTPPPHIDIHQNFLDMLINSKKIPENTKIIIFTLGSKGGGNKFLENVQSVLNNNPKSPLYNRITFFNFSEVLKKENYYLLDNHINSSGHQIVADSLIKQLSY